MKNIFFVTSNRNKLREAEAILGIRLNHVNLDIREVQSMNVEDVVKGKAKKAYELIKKPVLVEDTGFYISNANNFPGALVKWVLKTLGTEGLCNIASLNKTEKSREATVKTCYCLFDGKRYRLFAGELKGTVPNKPRGTTNFGWDPCFEPKYNNPDKKTFAEMTAQEKNLLSMRKIALEKLRKYIRAHSH